MDGSNHSSMGKQTSLVRRPINSVTPIYYFWSVPICCFVICRRDSSARGTGPRMKAELYHLPDAKAIEKLLKIDIHVGTPFLSPKCPVAVGGLEGPIDAGPDIILTF